MAARIVASPLSLGPGRTSKPLNLGSDRANRRLFDQTRGLGNYRIRDYRENAGSSRVE